MSEEEWLNVGTTFQASKPSEELVVIEPKEKKHKKKEKEKKKQQKQIVIEFKSTHFDINKEFAYKQEIGNDSLEISLIPFGDQKLLQYGHTSTDIPLYNRSKKDEQNYQALRYFDVSQTQAQTFKIRKVSKHVQQDYIEFNNELYQEEEENNEQIIKKNQQLQSMLQSDPHNLEGWKELLQIQDKLAATQGYGGDRVLMANRKLSIIGKLEQISELLADHPWVLVYKITLMEQFEELQDQIGQAYEELFTKYYHIRAVWVLYLEHRIRSQKFSSTLLRMESQKLFQRLQQLIQQSTRPQVISVLKKIYLELIRLVAFYEYQMGYKERATAILQALCELNLFAPASLLREYETRLEEFKKYYDAGFRTGETKQKGWDGSNHQREEFIGNYEQLNIITEEDPIEEFIQYQNVDRWRPANQNWEDVSSNIDKIIIFEEVEPYLMIFNDQESKLQLLNSLFELLGFPDIFEMLPNKLVQCDVNEYLMKFELKINNLSKWIYVQRLLEQLNYPELLLYKFIINGILHLNTQPSQYKQILKDNQNNLLLWILHAEFEEIRTNLNQDKLYQQIYRFAKSKKQKMMMYYFQFIKSYNHLKKLDIIKQVVALYDDTPMSHTTLILKLRQFISVAHPTQKPKKYFFQLSKKSMLLIFVMYLEQFQIESFIQTLAYSTENNLLVLNLLRFAANKEVILHHMKDHPFFFHQYVAELLPKYLYFHKLQQFNSIQQKLCIAEQIHKSEQKKGFLINLDKSPLTQLFCDAQDQENFDAFDTIKIGYQLDKYISQVSNVGMIYQNLKQYPYSVDFYRILIKEIQEYKEAIDILNEMSERELKYV